MKVKDLSREQLEELKQHYYCERNNASWDDLANIDDLVSDEQIFEEYDGVMFSNDDFVCSMDYDVKTIEEIKMYRFHYDDYIVDVNKNKDVFEYWISKKVYGVKKFMFGIPVEYIHNQKEMLEYIENNIDDYIDDIEENAE